MNEQFENRMKQMLKDEYPEYVQSLDSSVAQSARISPIKQPVSQTREELSFLGEPSAFCPDAYLVQGQYGLTPAHIQGLFYLQEPSASGVVECMDLQPDDVVLDLCAAPGSKSTQIAAKIPDGFLLANEYDNKRAQILLSNMERMGVENFAVTNQDSHSICRQFPNTFDKILVDAPCSGEGMIKKHSAAGSQWSMDNIQLCAARQKEILEEAVSALKPGGLLMYSTCTYAPEENEKNAAWLLEQFPELEQVSLPVSWGREGLETPGMDASKVRRVFPMDGGEGHFMAAFRKKEEAGTPRSLPQLKPEKPDAQTRDFLQDVLPEGYASYKTATVSGRNEPAVKGKKAKGKPAAGKDSVKEVYGMNRPFVPIAGKVLRQGVYLGTVVKGRFEPEHALFLSASMAKDGTCKTETTLEEMNEILHGRQIQGQTDTGWRALSYKSIPYGFGKGSQGRITSRIPKGLRLMEGQSVKAEN